MFENIEREGEIARNEQFLLFPQCFSSYCIDKLPSIFSTSKFVVCEALQFEKWKQSKVCSLAMVKCPVNLYQNKPLFLSVCSASLFKTLGKRKLARNWSSFCYFQNCRLQTLSVWKNLKFAIWERGK